MRFIKVLIPILFIITAVFFTYTKISGRTDSNAPVMVCDAQTIELSVNDGDEALLSHVTATDEKDGDLTSSVIVENISAFISDNSAKVTFAVCDSDNNVSKLETNIVFTDYAKPTFKMSKQQVYYTGASKVDLLSGVTAEDLLEGDISSRVVVAESQIDLSMPGVYPVTYRVTTSKGVTSDVTVNAYVYDSRLQYSIALSDYLVYTDKGKKLNSNSFIEDYPKEMLKEGYFTGYTCSLQITDEVDYSKPGTYCITYRLIRQANNNKDNTDILAESYLAVVVKGEDS